MQVQEIDKYIRKAAKELSVQRSPDFLNGCKEVAKQIVNNAEINSLLDSEDKDIRIATVFRAISMLLDERYWKNTML